MSSWLGRTIADGVDALRRPARTAEALETIAVLVGAAVMVIGFLVSLLLFWGNELSISGSGSIGLYAAAGGAIVAAIAFVLGRVAVRPARAERAGRREGGVHLRWYDLIAIAVAYASVALLGWLGIAQLLELSFIGAPVYAFPGAVLVGVAFALTAYVAFLGSASLTPMSLSLALAIFLVIGTFTGQIGGRLGSARLALIRTSGEGEKSQWLLHRMKESSSPPVRERPSSRFAVPERGAERRDEGRSGSGQRDEGRPESPLVPMLSSPGTTGLARALSTPAWAEIKWDGIRAIGTWSEADGGRFTLRARSGTDITARYPELTADGNPDFPASDAMVDGEIVAFDAQGRPSFSHLQNRMHLTRAREIEREVVRTPVVYLLFDLLRLDGHDLTALPLRQRRELLEQLASDLDAPVQVPPVFDDLDEALRLSREYGLEGVVAKDPASPYLPGIRAGSWLKLKNTRTQEAVIVGIRPGQGNRAGSIGSLLLAVPDAPASGASTGALRYVGRVGTGFTDRMLRDLDRVLQPLRVDDPPLRGVPALDSSDALWVRPELVGEVEFANWSPGGILRHARWRGLRSDKTVGDVRVEG